MPSRLVRTGPELIRWTGAGGPFEYRLCPRVFSPSLVSEAIAGVLDVVEGAGVVLDVGCAVRSASTTACERRRGRLGHDWSGVASS